MGEVPSHAKHSLIPYDYICHSSLMNSALPSTNLKLCAHFSQMLWPMYSGIEPVLAALTLCYSHYHLNLTLLFSLH